MMAAVDMYTCMVCSDIKRLVTWLESFKLKQAYESRVLAGGHCFHCTPRYLSHLSTQATISTVCTGPESTGIIEVYTIPEELYKLQAHVTAL